MVVVQGKREWVTCEMFGEVEGALWDGARVTASIEDFK